MPQSTDSPAPAPATDKAAVRWLPGHPFVVKPLDISGELTGEDLLSAVELAVESAAPVPLEQLAWGWYYDPEGTQVLIYMSLREMCLSLAPDFEEADYVLPSFLAALGNPEQGPCLRLVLSPTDASAVFFGSNPNIPDWIVSRQLQPDTRKALAKAEDATAFKAAALESFEEEVQPEHRLGHRVVKDDDDGIRGRGPMLHRLRRAGFVQVRKGGVDPALGLEPVARDRAPKDARRVAYFQPLDRLRGEQVVADGPPAAERTKPDWPGPDLVEEALSSLQLELDRIGAGVSAERRPVGVRVIAEAVPVIPNPTREVASSGTLELPPNDEERCRGAPRAKHLEDARRTLGMRAVVERQVNARHVNDNNLQK